MVSEINNKLDKLHKEQQKQEPQEEPMGKQINSQKKHVTYSEDATKIECK